MNSQIVKPAHIVGYKMQTITVLAPNNNDAALVTILAESASLLCIANAASIHDHHHAAGLIVAVLNTLDIVQVKMVAHFEHQVLYSLVVSDLFIII